MPLAPKRSCPQYWLAAAALALLLCAGAAADENAIDSNCRAFYDGLLVSFLDVGQGEAILIRCPDGITQTLVDAGASDAEYPDAAAMFRKALGKRLGSDRLIELGINTHPHPDHLHGFAELLRPSGLNGIRLLRYMDNGADNRETLREEETRQLARRYAQYDLITSGAPQVLRLCPAAEKQQDARIYLQVPDPGLSKTLDCANNLNDCSVVGRIEYDGISFLLLADAGIGWETAALHAPANFSLRSTVLKVGHHGADSTTAALLEAVQPAAAVLSTGRPRLGNTEKYGFPEETVAARLLAYFAGRRQPQAASFPPLAACARSASSCQWRSHLVPPSVWSTANHGTIDAYAKNGRLCVESRAAVVHYTGGG